MELPFQPLERALPAAGGAAATAAIVIEQFLSRIQQDPQRAGTAAVAKRFAAAPREEGRALQRQLSGARCPQLAAYGFVNHD